MMTEVSKDNVVEEGWRLKLGVALFALSIALPVLGVPVDAGPMRGEDALWSTAMMPPERRRSSAFS